MSHSRFVPSFGVCAAALLLLAACGSESDAPAANATATTDQALTVVASTNVYGDIAQTIGGAEVAVTSIISDPAADPHSYEANAQTQLALSKADVVIENGGGYDDFVDTMLAAADNPTVTVLNAVDISGKAAAGTEGLNEHVWYDLPSVGLLADELVMALSEAAPQDADMFAANAATFKTELAAMEKTEQELSATYAGVGVAITEPVPGYLLDAVGLVNLTPDDFAEAIEEGTDVPPAAMQETLDLFTAKAVVALFYNEQVTGAETDKVLAAAKDAGVAVVPVRETLPEGDSYVDWMTGNLTALTAALSK